MADVDELSFIVEGDPVGKGRPRFTRSGQVFTPEKTAAYERKVAVACRLAMRAKSIKTFDCAVVMRVDAYFPIPKSATKAQRYAAIQGLCRPSKPDIDNVEKSILDGCNGVAYIDDAQVSDLRCRKLYATSPRVEVFITPIEGVEVGLRKRKKDD